MGADASRRLLLLSPRGFCAGVCRAVDAVEHLSKNLQEPIYLLRGLVHNERVDKHLRDLGVQVVQSPEEVPSGGVLVYGAHGVSLDIEDRSAARSLRIMDATCPLVKQVHRCLLELLDEGAKVVLIGHRSHAEVQGTLGRTEQLVPVVASPDDVTDLPETSGRIAVLTQTTLSDEETAPVIDALKQRFPQLEIAGGICYATRNRQMVVRQLPSDCDTVIVVGSPRSSNTQRLREVAESCGKRAILILTVDELLSDMVTQSKVIAVTSGASTPESSVTEVVERLCSFGWPSPECMGTPETVSFPIPPFETTGKF